jgi:hypothetical protein
VEDSVAIASGFRAAGAVIVLCIAAWACGGGSSTPHPAIIPGGPTVAPQTYVVGADATHNTLVVFSVDTTAGTLTPAGEPRRTQATRTVDVTATTGVPLPAQCMPTSMSISGREFAIICSGPKTLDVLNVMPGTNNSITIDTTNVLTCPLGGSPGLLRSAGSMHADGEHRLYETVDSLSGAVKMCLLTPNGLQNVGSFSLPAGLQAIDLRVFRAPTGSAYTYYETYAFSSAGGYGMSFYGVNEPNTRTLINQTVPNLARAFMALDTDCDDGLPTILGAGPSTLSTFVLQAGVFMEQSATTVPWAASQSGPNVPNQIGFARVGVNLAPYRAFATATKLDILDTNLNYVTSTPLTVQPLQVRGFSGTPAFFGYQTANSLSAYKFDGTSLTLTGTYALSYRLSDFGILRYGYPRPSPSPGSSPTPTPTPTPGGSAYGPVILNPTFLQYQFVGQTQTFTATQSGNTGNAFTYLPITCPTGSGGAGTISQPSPGNFSVTVNSPSGTSNCTTGVYGLGGFYATMTMNF